MARVLLVQTAIGDYRQRFLEEMIDRFGNDFAIISGSEYFSSNIKTSVAVGDHLTIVANIFLVGRRICFQPQAVFAGISADIAILELNPRVVSNWFILLIRKALGNKKRTLLWGHAWPQHGKTRSTERVRNYMRKLADVIVVYTESQRLELQQHMGEQIPIVAAPNSLYRRVQMCPVQGPRSAFIYVGRLVPEKKPELLIRAFAEYRNKMLGASLLVVGDGPSRKDCEELAKILLPERGYEFLGHISSLEAISKLYGSSLASVSPGRVGLSITQSLGFGVPMIIARDEAHGPEIEAADEDHNCVFFESDNISSLGESMVRMWSERQRWLLRTKAIAEVCRKRYSVEAMADSFCTAIGRKPR